MSEVLTSVLGAACAIYTDEATRATSVSAYCEERDWTALRRRELASALKQLRGNGIADVGRLQVRKVRREDWAESWKRHFKPMEISRALLIQPSWSRRRALRGQAVVVLDPGLSFGTGQHATTRFCLGQLAVECERRPHPSFLDIGTGSGILAIAAAKLRCSPVEAFDFDPDAVRVARDNVSRNGVGGRVRLKQADLMHLPVRARRKFDVVCANLTDELLLSSRERILARLATGGRLVLAGMLRQQFARVRMAYEAAGLHLVARRQEGEWVSGAFDRGS